MKTCRTCGETKPFSEFHHYKSGRSEGSVYLDCKPCYRERTAAYYYRNRTEILAKMKASKDLHAN